MQGTSSGNSFSQPSTHCLAGAPSQEDSLPPSPPPSHPPSTVEKDRLRLSLTVSWLRSAGERDTVRFVIDLLNAFTLSPSRSSLFGHLLSGMRHLNLESSKEIFLS